MKLCNCYGIKSLQPLILVSVVLSLFTRMDKTIESGKSFESELRQSSNSVQKKMNQPELQDEDIVIIPEEIPQVVSANCDCVIGQGNNASRTHSTSGSRGRPRHRSRGDFRDRPREHSRGRPRSHSGGHPSKSLSHHHCRHGVIEKLLLKALQKTKFKKRRSPSTSSSDSSTDRKMHHRREQLKGKKIKKCMKKMKHPKTHF